MYWDSYYYYNKTTMALDYSEKQGLQTIKVAYQSNCPVESFCL